MKTKKSKKTATSKYVTIRFTKAKAYSLGLLICECGWPKNNHFDFDERVCAHNSECTGYKEVSRDGEIVN
jgi:hypothetical protein